MSSLYVHFEIPAIQQLTLPSREWPQYDAVSIASIQGGKVPRGHHLVASGYLLFLSSFVKSNSSPFQVKNFEEGKEASS